MNVEKIALIAVTLVLAGCSTVNQTVSGIGQAIADVVPTSTDDSPRMTDTAYVADQIFRPEFASKQRGADGGFAREGTWPMIDVEKIGNHYGAGEIPAGEQVIKFNCYMPYETTFAKHEMSLDARLGWRYELYSGDAKCTRFVILGFERRPGDPAHKSVERPVEQRLAASTEIPTAMIEEQFENSIAEKRSREQREAALARSANARANLSSGVGTKICPWPTDAYTVAGLRTYGFIERIENNKMQIRVVSPKQVITWDDPENWRPCN